MFDFKNKKVLFITTKNTDYLRNVQEVGIIKSEAKSLKVIGFSDKSYIKRLIKVFLKLSFCSIKDYDCIFVGFAPQFILPLFNFKFRKKQVIIDFFISVYDTLVFDRKKFKENSIFAKLCKFLDKKCIHSADFVISDTSAHGDYFSDEFSLPRERISTLYLKADTDIYFEREQQKPEKVKDKFVVLYFGSVLPLQGYDVIIKAMKLLKDKEDIFFYFIGPLKDKTDIKDIKNAEFIDWLSQEQLAEYISYADLCLAGHFNASINKAKRTIPGKAYIYEAMGKPMILGENAANRELYESDDKHLFVEMGSADILAKKILEIKKRS